MLNMCMCIIMELGAVRVDSSGYKYQVTEQNM